MNVIKTMWHYMTSILDISFNIAGFSLSFGGLLLFSCGFFTCWFVVGKLFR